MTSPLPVSPESLYRTPNALAPSYSMFRVGERLLLTGHSHQAWPDRGFEGQKRAWLDAARYLDKKWERAFEKADIVRKGFARLLDDEDGEIALGASVHDVVVRFLSALPLGTRPRIVTTDGEFHSLRRQFDRLAEEGVEVVRTPSAPAASVAERLIAAADDRTAAVMVSSVFFRTGQMAEGLGDVLEACRKVGAEMLVDVYHSLNVAPFSIRRERLRGAFVAGGGYKYCQMGEGNAFLRFPADCVMRPVVTGWFSEFGVLDGAGRSGSAVSGSGGPEDVRVSYGEGPWRFAGSTYDPTSHYRAAEVLSFFSEKGLTPALLREVSRHQVGLLAEKFDALDADPNVIDRDRAIDLDCIDNLSLGTDDARWM